MTTLTVCRVCHGEGELFGNPAAPDPRGETSGPCPRCQGTGLEPTDANWFDRLQDARAENHGELPDDFELTHVQPPSRLALPGTRPVDDPQAPPTTSLTRSAALADTSTRPDAERGQLDRETHPMNAERGRNRIGQVVNENGVTMCFHGRTETRGHAYEPGEYCPPGGPIEPGPCVGCGAPHGYPPAGPCLDHGTVKASA